MLATGAAPERTPTRPPRWRQHPAATATAALTPVVAALVVLARPAGLERPIGVALVLGLVVLAARRPDLTVTGLVLFLPFEELAFGYLLGHGVPASVLRTAGYWKEGLVAGVVLAAVAQHRRQPRRWDALDVAAAAYLLAVAADYAFPHLFAQAGLPIAPGAARLLAVREDALFVVAFLGARHARLGRDWAERFAPRLIGLGAVVGAIGIYQYFSPGGWNDIALRTFHLSQYASQVLKSQLTTVNAMTPAGGHQVLRVGSVVISPIVLGPWLLLPLGVGLEHLVRGGRRPWTAVAVGVMGTALLMTQTRSSIIGAAVMLVLCVVPAPGRAVNRRVQFAMVAAALVLLALPLAGDIGLSARTTSAINGTDRSSQDHVHLFWVGVDTMLHAPLGLGLGTAPGIGDRFDVTGRVTAENYYLQVGDEVGFYAFFAFAAVTVLMLRRLRRGQRAGPGAVLSGGVWVAAAGLAANAFLLHVWAVFVIALPFWLVAGAVTGIGDRVPASRRAAPIPV